MRYICDFETLWNEKPDILEANTYFWHGFYGNGSQRERKAMEYVYEVEDWYEDIANCLVKKKAVKKRDISIEIPENSYNNCVYFKINGEEVSHFCISSSRANVYKNQNIRKLKSIIKKEIGNVPVKIKKYSEYEEDLKKNPRTFENILFDRTDSKFLIKKVNELGLPEESESIAILNIGRKKYLSNIKCGQELCRIRATPMTKDVIDKITPDVCKDTNAVKSLSNILPEDEAEKLISICMVDIMENTNR